MLDKIYRVSPKYCGRDRTQPEAQHNFNVFAPVGTCPVRPGTPTLVLDHIPPISKIPVLVKVLERASCPVIWLSLQQRFTWTVSAWLQVCMYTWSWSWSVLLALWLLIALNPVWFVPSWTRYTSKQAQRTTRSHGRLAFLVYLSDRQHHF